MGRNSSPSPDGFDGNGNATGGNLFKRNPNPSHHHQRDDRGKTWPDRTSLRGRSQPNRFNRKGLLWLFPFKGKSTFYLVIIFAVFLFAMASMVLQSSITSVFRQGSDRGRWLREGLKLGSTLRFVPGRLARRLAEGDGLDHLRNVPRIAVRAPRLALVSVTGFFFFFC